MNDLTDQKEQILQMMFKVKNEYFERYEDIHPEMAERLNYFCLGRIRYMKRVLYKISDTKYSHNIPLSEKRFRATVEGRLECLKNRYKVQ